MVDVLAVIYNPSPLSNRPDEPHGSGREEASDNPSGRGLPRRKFLPRPRLRLAPIRRTSAGVQGLPTQTVSAKLRRRWASMALESGGH